MGRIPGVFCSLLLGLAGSHSSGIIGSHVSMVDVGRSQVFGPSGVMLLTVWMRQAAAASRWVTRGG